MSSHVEKGFSVLNWWTKIWVVDLPALGTSDHSLKTVNIKKDAPLWYENAERPHPNPPPTGWTRVPIKRHGAGAVPALVLIEFVYAVKPSPGLGNGCCRGVTLSFMPASRAPSNGGFRLTSSDVCQVKSHRRSPYGTTG